MKTSKYSLVTLAALATLSFANAQTNENAQKTDKSIPPSTKTSLLQALEGTTIGGYAYGQLTSMFGSDANGTSTRFRTSIDVNTGAYHGFSVGTRVFASVGAGAPNGGTALANSKAPNSIMDLGLYALYGRQTFETSATVLTAGKINIQTPVSDGTWDYGYGFSLDNYDVTGIGFHLQAYGTWALDDGNNIPSTANNNGINPDFASDKALFIFGISGDRKEFAGVGFELWAAHAIDTIDFLTFADLNYTIAGVTLEAQVATTQVNTSSKHFATKSELSAKLRGLYNVQLAYSGESGINVATGYTGSFGDGYGALLNGYAFNMAGQIWYDTVGANGYDLGGVGGYKNKDGKASTIQVAYFSLGYKGVKNLSLGLDYAYIAGNNNYMLMKKGQEHHPNTKDMNAKMHEVSLSTKYAFNDKLALSVLVGSTFGDLQMGRARARLTYSF